LHPASAVTPRRAISGAARRSRSGRVTQSAFVAALFASCSGPQSALDTAGESADEIATLFWVMAIGGTIIWLAVVALSIYAIWGSRKHPDPRAGRRLIIGGGVVFPTVILLALLAYSLEMLPRTLARGPDHSVRIWVSGEQWWWRIQYRLPDGTAINLANEIHLPVDRPVELELVSPDVIHSFWIPSLGGKMDMIPGRTTWLTLYPKRTGVFRGVCAEYCGASHAWMAFPVVVHEPAAYEQWLAHQAQPAVPPSSAITRRGQHLFLASGCGSCHAVRGTAATGAVGPDLTHVGSRLSLGAGRTSNEVADFHAWITAPDVLKPGAHMPAFRMLPPQDVYALAAYLESLQ
jgi:cytochrome c oxidase subunit II